MTEDLSYLKKYQRLIVGFSGGMDSVVLLHQLTTNPKLHGKILAVHVHHGLSPNADAWVEFCHHYCDAWRLPLKVYHIELAGQANLEERARMARFDIFSAIVQSGDALLLAHHEDDQAETVLLQLMRGAGVDGLSAMNMQVDFSGGVLIRPLLQCSRASMVDYARGHRLQWIEDESNQNTTFSRNYVRHQVIPILKARWPQAMKQLAKTAIHCQEAQSNLADLAHLDVGVTITSELDLNAMTFLPRGRLINALRFWFKKNQVKAPSVKQMDVIVDEVVGARGDAKAKFEGGSYVIRRFKNRLYLESNLTKKAPCRCIWDAFPQELCMEGMTIKAMRLHQGFGFYVPNGAHIDVRFRQNGEQLVYLQHTKSLKKILQSLDIAPWKRQEVPLVYINDKLAVVGRYVIADEFYKNAAEFAVYELCYD